jgi:alpha-tubulin suppressor-like RCC1 family protein
MKEKRNHLPTNLKENKNMNRNHIIRLTTLLLVLLLWFMVISGRAACVGGKKRTRAGSSTDNTFMINAPSNLTATAISTSQIDLSWVNNATNADGFEIERSLDGITYALLSTLNANTTTYSDTGLYQSTTYYYRVRAYMTTDDYSAYSNEVSATTFSIPPPQLPTAWAAIDAGYAHTIALASDGTLWAWGWNAFDQLGLGDTNNRLLPNPVGTDTDWDRIACGDLHNLALKNNRTLWSWGSNGTGQLGMGDTEYNNPEPLLVGTENDWAEIAGGSNFSFAIKTDGTLWSCGANDFGQLGLGDTELRTTLNLIVTETDWSIVKAGERHTIALKIDSTIWSWGNNWFGELGLGDNGEETERKTPTQVGTDSNWGTVGRGGYHSLAIKTNGTIWSWGTCGYGQLGLGDSIGRNTPSQIGTDSNWSLVTGGEMHTIALKTNDTIWGWGFNGFGQLGLGDNANRNTPSQTGTETDWSTIATGGNHTIALKTDGIIWLWGWNEYGQLGLGDTVNRNIPTPFGSPVTPSSLIAKDISLSQIDLSWADLSYNEVGFKIECKVGSTGTWEQIATIESNYYSHISATGFTLNTIYYYRVRAYNTLGNSGYSNIVSLAFGEWSTAVGGSNHTIALKTNGTLWSWGMNYSGQLGLGISTDRTTPSQIGTGSDWFTITAGNHSLAIKTNRTLWSWGHNSAGQLGLGFTTGAPNYGVFTPTQIGSDTDWFMVKAGEYHTLALKDNGALWSWGRNDVGQLGNGTQTNRWTPRQAGSDSDWSTITAGGGGSHSLAIKTNNTLWAWGKNDKGQLGLDGGGDRTNPIQVGTNSDWFAVFAGYRHTLACRTNGTLWACGYNSFGQLGLGDITSRNTLTQIGTDIDWVTVAAGGVTAFDPPGYTIAFKTNGTIWSWGANIDGQLGLGTKGYSDIRTTPTQIGINSNWFRLAAGSAHSIAITNNNALWIWGDNYYGQLGLGDSGTGTNRNTPTLVGE